MASAFSQLMEQLEDFKIRVDEQRRRQQRLSIIKSSVSLMICFLRFYWSTLLDPSSSAI